MQIRTALNYLGDYGSATLYEENDVVSSAGGMYISLLTNNLGHTPCDSPSQWIAVSRQGDPGLPGLTPLFTGVYDAARTYGKDDVVSLDGSSYVSLVDANTGHATTSSPAYWTLLASIGAQGIQGTPGTNGTNGSNGSGIGSGAAVAVFADALLPLNMNLFDVTKVTLSAQINTADGTLSVGGKPTNATALIYCAGATSIISNLPIDIGDNGAGLCYYDIDGVFIGSRASTGLVFGRSHAVLGNTAFSLPGTQTYVRMCYVPAWMSGNTSNWAQSDAIGMICTSIGGTAVLPLVYQAGGLSTATTVAAALVNTPVSVTGLPILPSATYPAGRMVFNTIDSKIYVSTELTWTSLTLAASQITGTLTDAQISALASSKITGTLTDAQLSAISSGKITGLLTDAQIAAIAGSKITGTLAALVPASQLTGQIQAAQIQANSIGAGQIAAGSITTAALTVSNFDNLVPNPNSEITTAPAGSFESNSLTWMNTTAYAICPSGYVRKLSPTQGQLLSAPLASISVNPGDQYLFQGQLAYLGGTSGRLYLQLCFYSQSWELTGTISTPLCFSGAWVDAPFLATATATVPAGSVRASLYLIIDSTTDNITNGVGNFFYLRRMADASLIVDGAITASKIAANTITANQIAAGSITALQIAADTITAGQIAAGAITTSELAAGSVTTSALTANCVTAGNIAAGAISASVIKTGTLDANLVSVTNLNAGNITAGTLAVGGAGSKPTLLAVTDSGGGRVAEIGQMGGIGPWGGQYGGWFKNLALGGSGPASPALFIDNSGNLKGSNGTSIDLAGNIFLKNVMCIQNSTTSTSYVQTTLTDIPYLGFANLNAVLGGNPCLIGYSTKFSATSSGGYISGFAVNNGGIFTPAQAASASLTVIGDGSGATASIQWDTPNAGATFYIASVSGGGGQGYSWADVMLVGQTNGGPDIYANVVASAPIAGASVYVQISAYQGAGAHAIARAGALSPAFTPNGYTTVVGVDRLITDSAGNAHGNNLMLINIPSGAYSFSVQAVSSQGPVAIGSCTFQLVELG